VIPYGRQHIDDDDIAAVVEVLKGDWLTTGPKIEEFEGKLAEAVAAKPVSYTHLTLPTICSV